MRKHRFTPDGVAAMEDRALMSGMRVAPVGFGAPAALGAPVAQVAASQPYVQVQNHGYSNGAGFARNPGLGGANTLGMSGAFVLTSRTYGQIQRTVDSTITNFTRNALTLLNRQGGFTNAFYDTVGVGTQGMGGQSFMYGRGTALAHVDSQMRAVEFRLPFGGGLGANNPTGGSGLSSATSQTSVNPGLAATGYLSVAEALENAVAVSSTPQDLAANLNMVRYQVVGAGGVLPSYISAFGPGGARYFGTRNT